MDGIVFYLEVAAGNGDVRVAAPSINVVPAKAGTQVARISAAHSKLALHLGEAASSL
jgi:hypothetical protein